MLSMVDYGILSGRNYRVYVQVAGCSRSLRDHGEYILWCYQMRDGVPLNDQRKEKQNTHPDRLMKLPDLEAYLKVPGDYPVAKVSFKIHKLPSVVDGFVESTD